MDPTIALTTSLAVPLSVLLVGGTAAPAGAGPTATCRGEAVTVDLSQGQAPTEERDVILGTPGADDIDGLGGGDRDLLNGAGGDDELDAGSGRDWCVGAGGEDLFRLCESVTDR